MFSLNATVPVFLMMVFGYFFKKVGIFSEKTLSEINRFVFKIALPVSLFADLAAKDFVKLWNGRFVLFCFIATLLSILLAAVISRFVVKGRAQRGEFIQAAYRSSAALVGSAFISNIYGDSAMAGLMIIGSVPLYNIFAVLVLTLTAPGTEKVTAQTMRKTLVGIVTNPIILGIAAGCLYSLLHIPMVPIVEKTTDYIGRLASPLGLMAMGGMFEWQSASKVMKPAICATIIKLFGFTSLFLPAAIALGFRNSELVAILVMLGSATTVAGYVMAKNMNHEGTLTSTVVMLTTMFSAFSFTFWLWILKMSDFV